MLGSNIQARLDSLLIAMSHHDIIVSSFEAGTECPAIILIFAFFSPTSKMLMSLITIIGKICYAIILSKNKNMLQVHLEKESVSGSRYVCMLFRILLSNKCLPNRIFC